MGLPLRDPAHHTYADYLTWGGERRFELIDGDAYAMAPAPDLVHQDAVGEVFVQVKRQLEGKPCRAFVAPVDVRLPRSRAKDQDDHRIDTVVQPDVFVVCDPGKLDRRGVLGAPDWIAEVLSPATAGHDQVKKRRVYEVAGVREYWLVHPGDRVVTVYRLGEHGQYGRPDVQELEGTTEVAVLPGVVVDWALVTRWLPPIEP
jgi:Uma2 family endonuclease